MSKASKAREQAEADKDAEMAADAAAAASAADDEVKAAAREVAKAFPVFVSHRVVRAALISQVLEDGCMVRAGAEAPEVKLLFQPDMTARYQPQAGDLWIFYADGYQSLSPAEVFRKGYSTKAEADAAADSDDAGDTVPGGQGPVTQDDGGLAAHQALGIAEQRDGTMVIYSVGDHGMQQTDPMPANSMLLHDVKRTLADLWADVQRRLTAGE